MELDWTLTEDLIANCPHCKAFVAISQINCQIFRHGSYIANGEQMNPHTPKEECDRLAAGGLIHGCGKPFRVVKNKKNQNVVVKCGYI
jgi:hypothetical protein